MQPEQGGLVVLIQDGEMLYDVPPEAVIRHSCKTCGHIVCVCDIKAKHKEGCNYRLSATCAVPIECEEHGRDVCPICDKCTCEEN